MLPGERVQQRHHGMTTFREGAEEKETGKFVSGINMTVLTHLHHKMAAEKNQSVLFAQAGISNTIAYSFMGEDTAKY